MISATANLLNDDQRMSRADADLLVSIRRSSLDGVRQALAAGARPNSFLGESQFPALISAMQLPHNPAIINALLMGGADPNASTSRIDEGAAGDPIFFTACRMGKEQAFRQMLETSNFPLALVRENAAGSQTAHLALSAMSELTLQAIQDHFERHIWKHGQTGPSEPGFGLPRSHLWIQPNRHGENAVMVAARSARALTWLLNHPDLDIRAHLEARDVHGRTALWKAVEQGISEYVDALLGAGAQTHVKNKDGLTLLQMAADKGIRVSAPPTTASERILAALRAHDASRRARDAVDQALNVPGPVVAAFP